MLYHDQTGRQPSLRLCSIASKPPGLQRVCMALVCTNATLSSSASRQKSIKNAGALYFPLMHADGTKRSGLPAPRKPDIFHIRDDSTGEEQGPSIRTVSADYTTFGIVTAGDAVRGLKEYVPYFSDTGGLVISILECLVADDGLEWTLRAFEPSFAAPEREKRAQEANEPSGSPKILGLCSVAPRDDYNTKFRL